MTDAEKLEQLKALLGTTCTGQDTSLEAYLALTKSEIIGWLYGGEERLSDTVPAQYDTVHIMACVFGFGQSGAEGQTGHSEGDIARTWKHDDMVAYVRSRVIPYAVVM